MAIEDLLTEQKSRHIKVATLPRELVRFSLW